MLSPCAACSYPARLLTRAVNPLSNEVLEYVNAKDSIIVIYDWEDTIAAPACALLSEKGVENVALLHGGELALLRAWFVCHTLREMRACCQRASWSNLLLWSLAVQCALRG